MKRYLEQLATTSGYGNLRKAAREALSEISPSHGFSFWTAASVFDGLFGPNDVVTLLSLFIDEPLTPDLAIGVSMHPKRAVVADTQLTSTIAEFWQPWRLFGRIVSSEKRHVLRQVNELATKLAFPTIVSTDDRDRVLSVSHLSLEFRVIVAA